GTRERQQRNWHRKQGKKQWRTTTTPRRPTPTPSCDGMYFSHATTPHTMSPIRSGESENSVFWKEPPFEEQERTFLAARRTYNPSLGSRKFSPYRYFQLKWEAQFRSRPSDVSVGPAGNWQTRTNEKILQPLPNKLRSGAVGTFGIGCRGIGMEEGFLRVSGEEYPNSQYIGRINIVEDFSFGGKKVRTSPFPVATRSFRTPMLSKQEGRRERSCYLLHRMLTENLVILTEHTFKMEDAGEDKNGRTGGQDQG
ncbi:unnamed protein product, partial [Nesidiocoris tenuis]